MKRIASSYLCSGRWKSSIIRGIPFVFWNFVYPTIEPQFLSLFTFKPLNFLIQLLFEDLIERVFDFVMSKIYLLNVKEKK